MSGIFTSRDIIFQPGNGKIRQGDYMHINRVAMVLCGLLFTWQALAGEADTFLRNVQFTQPLDNATDKDTVYAPHVAASPVVDGALDEEVWKKAKPVGGFTELFFEDKPLAEGKTELRFLWTEDTLFIGALCEAGPGGKIKSDASHDDRDKGAYSDDCLDILILHNSHLHQFIVSAGGARMDTRDQNASWNPEWKTATRLDEKNSAWTAEIAIPTSLMERRAAGYVFRFNVGRATAPNRIYSSLFPGYGDRDRFGTLAFGSPEERVAFLENHPRSLAEMQLLLDREVYDTLDPVARGRLRLIGSSCGEGTALNDTLRVTAEIVPEKGGAPLFTEDAGSLQGTRLDFDLDLRTLPEGRYVFRIRLKGKDEETVIQSDCPLIRKAVKVPPNAGLVPLHVNIPQESTPLISEHTPLPVYAGVPMPKGCVSGDTVFRLTDVTGIAVPCQVETLAAWGPDSSAKWLGVRFLASSASEQYTLHYAPAPQKAYIPRQPVCVTAEDQRILLNTGAARFEIRRDAFDGIHQAWMDMNGNGAFEETEALLAADRHESPYVVDQAGRVYSTDHDREPEITVESAGPVCAVIRVESWYTAEDGSRIARHVTRIYAYAGQIWLRIRSTFIFCADSNSVKIADIGWPTRLADAESRYRFGTHPKSLSVEASGASQIASLLQHEENQYDLRLIQSPGEKNEGMVYYGTGMHALGWIEQENGRAALALGQKAFWQTYPKELTGQNGAITLHLWPSNGLDKLRKPLSDENLSELHFVHHRKLLDFDVPDWFSSFKGQADKDYRYVRASANSNGMGVARSCELFLNLRPIGRNTTPAVATFIRHPALAHASPEWMCDSGAFGEIQSADRKAFPIIEDALEARFDGERMLEHFSVGMWNYGGSVTYFDYARRTYQQLERPWRLTHHGGPRIPWILFARTGERKYFDYAYRNSMYCADIGFCHYSNPVMERLGYSGKIRGAQCDYKGIVPWHSGGRVMDYNSMADFLHYLHYLTGNPWPFEVSQEWGACVKRRFRPCSARSGSGSLDTLLSLYEGTHDMDYREMAERQFRFMANDLLQKNGYFSTGNWYDYAPWLSHYYRLTGSASAEDAALRWAGRLIKEQRLNTNFYGTDTSFGYGMGYPLYDVFRLAWLASGDERYRALGLGCAKIVGMSVFNDPGSFMHGCDMYSNHSAGGYYQQTVPYLLPLLKADNRPRAEFPRWQLSGKRIRFLILDPGDRPLTLRWGTFNQYTEKRPVYRLSVRSKDGKTETRNLEIKREQKITSLNRDHAIEFIEATFAPAQIAGQTEIVISAQDESATIFVWLPTISDRPVEMVVVWDESLGFARGAALYFPAPTKGGRMAVRAFGRQNMPHALAFLDARDNFVATKHWYAPENPGWVDFEATIPAAADERIWCLLYSLQKSLEIRPSAGLPPVFADRPERWFLPKIVPELTTAYSK
jgi:hypothetical protein